MKTLIPVWDPLIRVFHWSLVFFFFVAYLLEGDRPNLHSQAGYTVLLLIIFRLFWGFWGTRHARFSDFVKSHRSALLYLKSLVHRKPQSHEGHDPLGGFMILALMGCLFMTTLTGVILFGMEGSGPLANSSLIDFPGKAIEDLHGLFADLSVILILFHILGVLTVSWLSGQNLVKSMLTGRKNKPQSK